MPPPNSKVADIASSLALTPRRIQQLVKENILPPPDNGKYDKLACIQSYKKYLQNQSGSKNNSPTNNNFGNNSDNSHTINNKPTGKNNYSNLNTERLRLLSAQADKAELEVAVLEGKYIATTEVELLWSSLLIAFRARMLSMPTSIARPLIALGGDLVAVTSTLEQEIHSALLELSNYSSLDNYQNINNTSNYKNTSTNLDTNADLDANTIKTPTTTLPSTPYPTPTSPPPAT